jgi:hypothetical protein
MSVYVKMKTTSTGRHSCVARDARRLVVIICVLAL